MLVRLGRPSLRGGLGRQLLRHGLCSLLLVGGLRGQLHRGGLCRQLLVERPCRQLFDLWLFGWLDTALGEVLLVHLLIRARLRQLLLPAETS